MRNQATTCAVAPTAGSMHQHVYYHKQRTEASCWPNPEPNQGGNGIRLHSIQMPKEGAPAFFPSSSCDHHLGVCAEGLGCVASFPQEATLPRRVTSRPRPLKRFETNRTHTLPTTNDACLPRFWGTPFHLACFPPDSNERKGGQNISKRN